MHPSRRRKKRPNYGIRTVEVMRGPNGFGFTISGQQPCILSCIVSNSPADQAGLRAGDFLISVNGVSVSKITHDAVVNLIGNTVGPIRMTIAENYYSDSSDEDIDLGRVVNSRKPKYMHKPRMHKNYKHDSRNVGNDRLLLDSSNKKAMKVRECAINHNPHEARGNMNVYSDEASGTSQNLSNSMPMEEEGGPIEYKVIVGYLGTIEMPKQLLPNSRLQTVCTCIRKLRQEKRTPTAVLMTVLPTCLTLKNSSNHILAIYPTNRVVYISSSSDKDSRYFGLVTSAVCDTRSVENVQKRCENSYVNIWETGEKKCNNLDEKPDVAISNSCHIFVTDPKIVDHEIHVKKAENFKITCTADVITGNCLEFPRNALYIVSLVQNMYRLQSSEFDASKKHINEEVVANSPQPSASSNSDSGIGFRDDCGNISDRILVVEFPSHRPLPLISNNHKRPINIAASNITLENLDVPLNNDQIQNYALNNVRCKNNFDFKLPNNLSKNFESLCDDSKHLSNLNNIRACENVCIKNAIDKQESPADYLSKQNNEADYVYTNHEELSSRLTVRAMPNPRHLKVRELSPQSTHSSEECSRNGDVDSGQVFTERPVDVPDNSPSKKSYETVSLHSMGDDTFDFKSSVDNISMHSSKSFEFSNLKVVFKTPSSKFLDKKKSTKRHLKMVSSCDNLVSDKDEASVLNYKLSPKVYGVAKPTHSCEELKFFDSEKFGFGSLQDLCSWSGQSVKPGIAQSEPDVRLPRRCQNSTSGLRCNENGEHKSNSEGPASWATSFEKLLDCPIGLHTFAGFLKKEFSAENIYFWTACERFKRLPPGPEKTNEAQRIYQQHLCIGAPEAINVDSRARQCTEQSLQEPNNLMFDPAQKQIFNLMKFDSYPRFLKSDMYKECLSGNIEGPELDTGLLIQPPNITTPGKLKKSLSNAEDRRRKSLLPWHRKNRSRSKDRGESEYNQKTNDATSEASSQTGKECVNDVHGSSSSLTSLDLAVNCNHQMDQLKCNQEDLTNASTGRGSLCRVILSNGSTTVVQIRQSETILGLVNRVLDKRGLTYKTYDVSTDKHSKPLDLNEPSTTLAGCEVCVEERVSFRIDLPNRKVISVKSKCTKILASVLKQVLNRYNFSLEEVIVTVDGEPIDVNLPVTSVDSTRLQIHLNVPQPKYSAAIPTIQVTNAKILPSLDEITNKVYEDILQEKADSACLKAKSDKGSVKSEDWGSEHSSGIFGRFLRRDSGVHERKKKLMHRSKGNSTNSSVEDVNGEHANGASKKPLIAKWKPGVKLQMACSESDELYEGLSRAQRSRLEDQRGTEINFELPDFLKDKENNQITANNGRKLRRPDENGVETTRFYTGDSVLHTKQDRAAKNLKLETHSNYENRTIMANESSSMNSSCAPNNHTQPTRPGNLRIYVPNKFLGLSEESSSSNQSTPTKNGLDITVIENVCKSDDSLSSIKNGDPPPLPPKPKIVPSRPSNWGQNGFFKSRKDVSPRRDCTKPGLYLEQPTSSFV